MDHDLPTNGTAQNELRSNKRRREEGDDESQPGDVKHPKTEKADAQEDATTASDPPKISKNQLKKLKRRQAWEEKKEDRKAQRKEKRHDRSARKKTEREIKVAEAVAAGMDPEEALKKIIEESKPKRSKQIVPISFIIDCDFESYMLESELVSLSSQVVRCYSQNRQGDYQAHVTVSSFQGKMKERFETVLKNTHKSWKAMSFVEGDFVEAGKLAHELMRGPKGGKLCPSLGLVEGGDESMDEAKPVLQEMTSEKKPKTEAASAASASAIIGEPASEPSIIYLSADSKYTLEKLEPYTSYVIGGIVDRNREKGLCQKRAEERGIKTAKLPIGEYMQMASRQVLATNHVVEIMSKWLETGDWGTAFMSVIPKRKGGKLKGGEEAEEEDDGQESGDDQGDAAEPKAEEASTSVSEVKNESKAEVEEEIKADNKDEVIEGIQNGASN